MVSAGGSASFESDFSGPGSRPGADARSTAQDARPEAANAVNQLADSFREILMRAVETDPSQVQALTDMVTKMGLKTGDGPSQEDIDKMAQSLTKLSVDKQPAEPAHEAASTRQRMPQATRTSAPEQRVPAKPATGRPAVPPERLSTEAAQLNDTFQSMKLQTTMQNQEAENESSEQKFHFRAVPSAEKSVQPALDPGASSRKSPLRPAPSRTASRRTRQRPGSQPVGAANQPAPAGPLPSFGIPQAPDTASFGEESRHADIMKAALRAMDDSSGSVRAPQSFAQQASAVPQDASMETAAPGHSEPPLRQDQAASLPFQPPQAGFPGTARQAPAATLPVSGPSHAQPSHPVAPFPQPFSQGKPQFPGAAAPPVDIFTAAPTSTSRSAPPAAAEAANPMETAPPPRGEVPAVPFPARFGDTAADGGGAAGLSGLAPGSGRAPINPFSPSSQSKFRAHRSRSPQKGAALSSSAKPLFASGSAAGGAAPTPPAPAEPDPSFALFSGGSTGAGVPLQPTSPPILAFTVTRQAAGQPGGLRNEGDGASQPSSFGGAPPPTTTSQPFSSFPSAATASPSNPFVDTRPSAATVGAAPGEPRAQPPGHTAPAAQSIPAWPSSFGTAPTSPTVKSGGGGAAAAAGSTFGSAFHPGVSAQDGGLTRSGHTPPSGRGRKSRSHVLRNRASSSIGDRKSGAQRHRRESLHAMGDSPKASSADPGSPFAMAGHSDLGSVRAFGAAGDEAVPRAEAPRPPQLPQPQQAQQAEAPRPAEHVDSDSTDSNASANMSQHTRAVPRGSAAWVRRTARAAAPPPGTGAASPRPAGQEPPAGRPSGTPILDFVFGMRPRQGVFGANASDGPLPDRPRQHATSASQPQPAAPSAASFSAASLNSDVPQRTPVGHMTPHMFPEVSAHTSPMSTAPPFHPEVDNPFARSSESARTGTKMFTPPSQLRFTATPPSADGATLPKAQPHGYRARAVHRRRQSSAAGADPSASPSSNPPIDACATPQARFAAVNGAATPMDTAKPLPPGHMPFHMRAKENNSPRSNSAAGAAPRAAHPGSLGSALPDPLDAMNVACEHRNRGNALFKQKQYPAAEFEYSAALKALLAHRLRQPADVKARQVAVFYSNRAAAKLMLNRPQDALPDCHAALEADETYRRALERAASCYRRMGDLKKAEQVLAQAVAASATAPSSSAEDRAALSNRLAEVRQLRAEVKELWGGVASASSPEALAKLNKETAKLLVQLQDCPRARLLRAAAHIRCGAWEAACSAAAAAGEWEPPRIKLQAWWLNCECLYAQGDLERCARRLESGLEMLRSLEEGSSGDGGIERRAGDCVPLPSSARVKELASKMVTVLRCKQQGNTAFQQKDYAGAERQYTAALAVREVAAPGFSAVLYSNRAAVHMEQKRWVDALADCGRARALNPVFHKVLRRLSKIHEELGRHGQASELLQELKTVGGVTGADSAELSRMVMQLEAKRRMEGCPNHFRMLNVATAATVPELKTAFRRLAVQYHPDKALAGCAAQCSLGGVVTAARDEGLHGRLRTSANELFQLVNEAWETLQNPSKRQMCRIEHDEDYLQHDADAFAFMYDNISSKFGSSFPSRRRW